MLMSVTSGLRRDHNQDKKQSKITNNFEHDSSWL